MIVAALLLLAAEPAVAVPAPSTTLPAPVQFAPPLGQPMTYRVTTRRLARDGSMTNYSIVYALRWERVGRGVQLVATLQRVESDARPELAGMVAKLLQPLVGQDMTYLVAPDGSRIDLVDPEGLWRRVLGTTQDVGAASGQAEARQMAAILAGLSAAERDRLATSDIRALVAGANPIPPAGEGVTMAQDGGIRTVTRRERAETPDAKPLEIELGWRIDTATGLVVEERRRSWTDDAAAGRKLVEERIRALEPLPRN